MTIDYIIICRTNQTATYYRNSCIPTKFRGFSKEICKFFPDFIHRKKQFPLFGKNCLYFSTFLRKNQLFFSYSFQKTKQSWFYTTASVITFSFLLCFTILMQNVSVFLVFWLFSELFVSQSNRLGKTPVSPRYSIFYFILPKSSLFLQPED